MLIKYKRIKKQAYLVERLGLDLFSDPVIRAHWLKLLLSHSHPFDYMILLHIYPRYENGDKSTIGLNARRYWKLMERSDGIIELTKYPPEVRKIIYEVFYNHIRLPLNASPMGVLYGELKDTLPIQNLETPYADIEVIID